MLEGTGHTVSRAAVTVRLRIAGSGQAPDEMGLESRRRRLDAGGSAMGGQLGHLQSRKAARIDPAERLEVHADIQRKPVVARSAPDAQADAGELAAADVDTRSGAAALGGDAELVRIVDHGLLERGDEIAHTQL